MPNWGSSPFTTNFSGNAMPTSPNWGAAPFTTNFAGNPLLPGMATPGTGMAPIMAPSPSPTKSPGSGSVSADRGPFAMTGGGDLVDLGQLPAPTSIGLVNLLQNQAEGSGTKSNPYQLPSTLQGWGGFATQSPSAPQNIWSHVIQQPGFLDYLAGGGSGLLKGLMQGGTGYALQGMGVQPNILTTLLSGVLSKFIPYFGQANMGIGGAIGLMQGLEGVGPTPGEGWQTSEPAAFDLGISEGD
jgi:hypothetical protein